VRRKTLFDKQSNLKLQSRDATHINFKVFDLTRPGLEPTFYHTRGEHGTHYATDAVFIEANLKHDLT
jgi:hypothetical protein